MIPRLLLVVVALLGITNHALAHGLLKHSTPAAGAHLSRVPRELRLVFHEPVERAFTVLAVRGPEGILVRLGPVEIMPDSPTVAKAPVLGRLVPGTYEVAWQTAGHDGHPVRGSFRFTIVPGAAGLTGDTAQAPSDRVGRSAPHHDPTAMPGSQGSGAFDAESPLYVGVRWLTLVGLVGIVGALAFRFVVIGRMSRRGNASGLGIIEPALDRASALAIVLGFILLAGTILRLFAQSVAMHGADGALPSESIEDMVIRTAWGRAWLLQLFGATIAIAAFWMARRGRSAGWIVAVGAAVLLAFSAALSGHAASTPRFSAIAITSDALHVIGAGGWLGSLLFVVACGIPVAMRSVPADRGPAVADLVEAFSPTALAFAGLVTVTGVVAAWLHLERISALWETTYGRTLLLKLGILSVVALTGAYNWLKVRPALGDEIGVSRVRRSASVELGVAALVLAVTAVLVATPVGMK